MGYINAEELLPQELIELIQKYVDGTLIYIPRKPEHRLKWGTETTTRADLRIRNQQIYADYLVGTDISSLATKYYLSTKSIQRIIREQRT